MPLEIYHNILRLNLTYLLLWGLCILLDVCEEIQMLEPSSWNIIELVIQLTSFFGGEKTFLPQGKIKVENLNAFQIRKKQIALLQKGNLWLFMTLSFFLWELAPSS